MELTRLFDIPAYQLKTNPLEDMFVTKINGVWTPTSTKDFIEKSNAFSRGLLEMGVKPGDKIALISDVNITAWNIMDYGVQQVGAVTVPVYPTIGPDDYEYIFNDSNIKYCFVNNEELFLKINSIKDKVESLVGIYTIYDVPNAPNWEEVLDKGKDSTKQEKVEEVKKSIKPDDMVTIIYTSGTTGKPKGVMLTHNNILSNTLASAPRIRSMPEGAKALSFLPICHIFERMLTYVYQYKCVSISYAEGIDFIADNLKEVKPHMMSVVPRLLEKVYASIYEKGQAAGGIKTKLFNWALSLVETYEPYSKKGFIEGLKHDIANKLVFSKWREGMGGNIVSIVSGAAALSPRLAHVFHGAGIPILEGYGMTETSPVVSVGEMTKAGLKIGSVGKVLDKVEVKIAEDGEILVKGPNVTPGYYNNPEKTKDLFNEDGYLMTGDIGELCEKGFLKITDRKKEMFKTSGGKYIAPQPIENELKQSRYIENIMVTGEGEKMPTAIIQPNFVILAEWLKGKGVSDVSPKAIAENSDVFILIEKEVETFNLKLGSWERIKKIALTPDEWTIESGLLTPTMKMKRKPIMAKYKDLYEKMYGR